MLFHFNGFYSLLTVIELQFSQNLYQSTLIKDVTTVPGSHVATLGFNRPLLSTENLLFLPETTKLSFNASSLELILEQSINSSFWVVVGVTSGTLKTAKIDVIVINPGRNFKKVFTCPNSIARWRSFFTSFLCELNMIIIF